MTQSFEITWRPCWKEFNAQTLLLASVCVMILPLKDWWSHAHITLPWEYMLTFVSICIAMGWTSPTQGWETPLPQLSPVVVLSCIIEDVSRTGGSSVELESNLSVVCYSKKRILNSVYAVLFLATLWAFVPCVWWDVAVCCGACGRVQVSVLTDKKVQSFRILSITLAAA